MNRAWLSVLSLVVLLVGTGLFLTLSQNGRDRVSLSAQEVVGKTTTVSIGQQQFVVELAVTLEEQAQGLSDRDALPRGAGMLFVFEESRETSFWMNKMRFPLDIIWIRDGRVVGVERRVPPPDPKTKPSELATYPSPGAVSHVLEVNAGEADSVEVGDEVTIRQVNGI